MRSSEQPHITVLTAITGGKNALRDNQVKGKAHFVAFLDTPQESKTWEVKKAYDRFKDPRRNSRVPKLLSHQYCDTEYSIWIDGSMRLLKAPEKIIARHLKDHDIAVFGHNLRDCIYDEAMTCATARLDDPEVIMEQAATYERRGYEKHKGLAECGFILRRHTPKVIQFNNAWWSEYTRHSTRDQVSFMYAADSVGIRVNLMDMQWRLSPDGLSAFRGDFLELVPHLIRNPMA